VHGVVRASDDIDVLVTDRRCLEPATWAELADAHDPPEIHHGDSDDPLAGVVWLAPPQATRIDIVVGRSDWQDGVLTRAPRIPLLGTSIPVVLPVDLVLLKLYAGGPQDAWDVDQLLDAVPGLESDVTPRLTILPAECTSLWNRIVAGRQPR
jgi:hypothetical protein